MEARPGCERGATFERSENGVESTLPPAGATTGQPGFAAGERRPNGSKGRGFAVGAPARRSRDGNGKTSAPVGPMTGQPGFAGRNATEWEQGPGRERKPRVGKEESPPLSRGRLRNLPMALLS
ncbi:hypothetical protein DWW15_16665 [Subdoligranulum sp. AF14-43]|nr:hypothetical protein DWW15_16665 [Subdoligranulum sp. AF14-43]